VQITLNELKAENAAAEAAANNNPVDDVKEDIKDEYVDVTDEVKADAEESEPEDKGEQETELESWQLTEDTEASESEEKSGFVPNQEAAKRRKQAKALKGQLKEKDSELDELRKQVEELKSGIAPPAQQEIKPLVRPTREQFDYDDDAYDAAIDAYYDAKVKQNLEVHSQSVSQQAQQEAAQKKAVETQQKALDNHYDRAAALVSDGKVTEESFRNADTVVRQSLDMLQPGNGDMLTNALISTLNATGEGSEKVMYMLGNNPVKMQELQNKLMTDPSGLAASAYLGQLQAQVQTPGKRRSQTPKPASKVDGEGGGSGAEGQLKKKYDKSDDLQTRITLKREAKNKGIDVTKW
tara:strand:- start:578 stop:1633 length:1056 start_codon:yes stop_codon:yes gene_type:complete